MKKKVIILSLVIAVGIFCNRAGAAQKLIAGVPNYDQDVFPIDNPSVEGGDCVPTACTMLHGYWDSNGWPRLIPYGSSAVNQNAWGIDTVVRKYKQQLNYTPNNGVYFSSWDTFLGNPLGNGILAVVRYFDAGASFTREDDDWTSWSLIQSYLNANYPCVLTVLPQGVVDEYKWEGNSTLQELGGGHAVCAVGWSDVGGRWVMCNMGWLYTTRAWFNYDSGDDWYISQIAPGGTSSGEDDDAYEDNDTFSTARAISTGTLNNLRCLDTLLAGGFYSTSYGDWFKVNVSAGQTLSVTINFTTANGDLDLRVYDSYTNAMGASTGSGNSETINVSPTNAGYCYIFVYGYNNVKNQNYSLVTQTTWPLPSVPTATAATSVTSSGFNANWSSVPEAAGYRLDVSTNNSFTTYINTYQDLDVGNVTSRSVSGLSVNTTYYYRVRSYSTGGTSANSGTVTVTTVLPIQPSLSYFGRSGNIVFSWPTNASGFTLERATNLPPTWEAVSPAPVTVGVQYVVTNEIIGGAAFFRLRSP